MGLIVDTGIFIRAERDGHRDPTALVPAGEELGISIITLSELLEGVHLANSPARAARRAEYIERLKKFMSIMSFDGQVVEVHAKLRATQRQRGKMIGARDLIIAATAQHELGRTDAERHRIPPGWKASACACPAYDAAI